MRKRLRPRFVGLALGALRARELPALGGFLLASPPQAGASLRF